jgi:hypothetical protein
MVKYDIKELANATFPLPSTPITLETYGNVISGNINKDILRIVFIKKL